MDEEKAGWISRRRDIHEAGGEIWENRAQLSVRKLPFLSFPHILQVQMKQKHKVSCHNKDCESTDKEVHLESEKELTEIPAGEKKTMQIRGWIYNNLDNKRKSSQLGPCTDVGRENLSFFTDSTFQRCPKEPNCWKLSWLMSKRSWTLQDLIVKVKDKEKNPQPYKTVRCYFLFGRQRPAELCF